MTSRPPWYVGLIGQTLIPMAAGMILVVGLATTIVHHLVMDWQRDAVLDRVTNEAKFRSEREQARFDQVERQVLHCRRMLVERMARGDAPRRSIPRDGDGAWRLIPSANGPPLAGFIAASTSFIQRSAAETSCDLLEEFGPALAEELPNLTIAMPGRWLVGWGPAPAELVAAMLPNDPVLLPAEKELLAGSSDVRWSSVFYEPGTDRWVIAAMTAVDLPALGRVAITQTLIADELLLRATNHQHESAVHAVIDQTGRLLAHSQLMSAIRSANGRLMARDVQDPLLRQAATLVSKPGPSAELITAPDNSCWIGASRFPGPGWSMLTIYPRESIERRAQSVALTVVFIGSLLLLCLSTLVALILRRQVGRPIQRLRNAAIALTDGTPTTDLSTSERNEIGDLSRAFQTMADAVTTRERDLERALVALREREALSTALIDSAADAMFLVVDGCIVDPNPRAVELFGCTDANQLIGHRPETLSPPFQASGEPSARAAQRFITQTNSQGTQYFSWRHRRMDGTEFDAEVGLARIELPGPLRQLAVVRDVTKRNQMESQLRQGQKLESLGQLAGGIAHDFNNMLAGIMGTAELVVRSPLLDDKQRKRMETILTACERAAGLTGKLLTFARKGRSSAIPTDLHQVIRDAAALLEHSLDKRIHIELNLGTHAANVIGDPAQLQNMLINLGVNARDAMPDGGSLTISTMVRTVTSEDAARLVIPLIPGEYLEIAVTDTGTGIPPEIVIRIFEPFFTTKAVGKGTGLGLAAVYGTIQDHHGSIAIDSTVGIGTTFRLLLPPGREEEAPVAKSNELVHQERPGAILVVDDEETVRNACCQLLAELGWSTFEASDGVEALEVYQINREKIAAVLLDMEMPRMRGIDCLRHLRTLDPQVRAVLCSGFSRDINAEVLRHEGFLAIVAKPYRLKDLNQALDVAMAVR